LLFPPILDEFGWERGVTAGAFSFGFIVSAVLSPLLGRVMDRCRRTRVSHCCMRW
jgi:branched-subunit amino acid permease